FCGLVKVGVGSGVVTTAVAVAVGGLIVRVGTAVGGFVVGVIGFEWHATNRECSKTESKIMVRFFIDLLVMEAIGCKRFYSLFWSKTTFFVSLFMLWLFKWTR